MLWALASEPLDVHQLAADLQLAPFALHEILAELAAAELAIDEPIGESRREVWRLTFRGRQALKSN